MLKWCDVGNLTLHSSDLNHLTYEGVYLYFVLCLLYYNSKYNHTSTYSTSKSINMFMNVKFPRYKRFFIGHDLKMPAKYQKDIASQIIMVVRLIQHALLTEKLPSNPAVEPFLRFLSCLGRTHKPQLKY